MKGCSLCLTEDYESMQERFVGQALRDGKQVECEQAG